MKTVVACWNECSVLVDSVPGNRSVVFVRGLLLAGRDYAGVGVVSVCLLGEGAQRCIAGFLFSVTTAMSL